MKLEEKKKGDNIVVARVWVDTMIANAGMEWYSFSRGERNLA